MSGTALTPELAVTDIAASRHFYLDILGFELVYERPEEGFAFLAYGGSGLMLDQIGVGRTWVTGPLEPPLGRGVNLQFPVVSLEPLLERLQRAGIGLFLEPEARAYRVGDHEIVQQQFCVQDPDGYLLRFCSEVKSR